MVVPRGREFKSQLGRISKLKKSLSLCSPQGLALSGMARVRGVFPRPGEAVLLSLNEKRWGPFTPSRFF